MNFKKNYPQRKLNEIELNAVIKTISENNIQMGHPVQIVKIE